MAEEAKDKTENATPFKLSQARKKGNVAKSADVVSFLVLFFTLFFLFCFGSLGIRELIFFINKVYLQTSYGLDKKQLLNLLTEGLFLWLLISLPLFLVAMFSSILASVLQFGFLFSSYPLKFDLKKLNPVSGLKKLISKDKLIECIKQVAKFSIIISIIYYFIKSVLIDIISLFRLPFYSAISVIIDISWRLIFTILMAFLIIAIFDFFWQKYSFLKTMKMSKDEIKREYKQQEGDPLLKEERRRLHEEVLEDSGFAQMEHASVLLTNPVHLAVAIKYDEEADEVPKVLAKGYGKKAQELQKLARKSEVPIIRNIPLARDLQWLDIDEEIPQHLYEPVAEVLNFIAELKQKNPLGSSLK